MPDESSNVPANPVSATWWGLKWLSTLTPDRILMLLFVAAVVMMYYDSREEKKIGRAEMGERLDQRERDQIAEREAHRKHEVALVTVMMKNANEQDAARRAEERQWREKSEAHMKAAEATLKELATAQKDSAAAQIKLADAVNAFTKKVGPVN